MIYFICDNDYQVMKAIAYALSFSKNLHIFNLNDKEYQQIDNVEIFYPYKDILTNFKSTIQKPLSQDTIYFLKVLYDKNSEIHTFSYIDELFNFGRDNITLHDQGDSSYTINDYQLQGEALPDTLTQYITQYPVDDNRNILWDFSKSIQQQWLKAKLKKVFNCSSLDDIDYQNTILYIHNEPDNKYTSIEKQEIYNELISLLTSIKEKGYNLVVKTHHKRNCPINFNNLADKVITKGPVELIDNIDKFKYIISIRNSAIETLNYSNCINGLTKQAITHCKKNWKYVYLRGINKLKKKLNLNN